MEWYYAWWPWLTSKRVTRVCQHQVSLLCWVSINRLGGKLEQPEGEWISLGSSFLRQGVCRCILKRAVCNFHTGAAYWCWLKSDNGQEKVLWGATRGDILITSRSYGFISVIVCLLVSTGECCKLHTTYPIAVASQVGDGVPCYDWRISNGLHVRCDHQLSHQLQHAPSAVADPWGGGGGGLPPIAPCNFW